MEDSERIGRKQSLSPTVAIIKLGGQTFVPVGDTRILEGDMSIMDIACQLARDASWYSADDENYVRKHLHENGFILKAKADGCLAGFLIVRFPKDAGDNLGSYVRLTKEQRQYVAHMESVAVSPDYRGNKLQRCLMAEGEKNLKDTQYKYLMGTAHPENIYSVKAKLDYEIVAEDNKYGGRPGYVFFKKIEK